MIKKLGLFMMFWLIFGSLANSLPNPAQDSRIGKVYDHLEEQLIWIHKGEWTKCATALLEAFSRAGGEGLRAEDYAPFVEALNKANLASPESQKKADELLTLAALKFDQSLLIAFEPSKPDAAMRWVFSLVILTS